MKNIKITIFKDLINDEIETIILFNNFDNAINEIKQLMQYDICFSVEYE
jgi:hypothetical protein